MVDYNWDTQIEYLKQTRSLYYNDDYLRFLVRDVWKITHPVNVVDFGCGYGYMGLKLLDLLPSGCTYTGLDSGKQLIEEARLLFEKQPYDTEFFEVDLNEYTPVRKYDIAVCHAFLLHMEDPAETLNKMIESVKEGGMVICFEPHWIASMSNTYMGGVEHPEIVKLGILQKLYESSAGTSGRDGNIGIRIPQLMSEQGLKDIQCRVSDKVNFYDPMTRDRQLFRSLQEEGLGNTPQDRAKYIERLLERGLNQLEAEELYDSEYRSTVYFNEKGATQTIMFAPNMKISFGKVASDR